MLVDERVMQITRAMHTYTVAEYRRCGCAMPHLTVIGSDDRTIVLALVGPIDAVVPAVRDAIGGLDPVLIILSAVAAEEWDFGSGIEQRDGIHTIVVPRDSAATMGSNSVSVRHTPHGPQLQAMNRTQSLLAVRHLVDLVRSIYGDGS